MEVWISSGTHVDSIAERENEIKKQFASPDIIFGEGAEKSTAQEQLESILKITPIAPLLAAAVTFHIYISVELRGWIKSKISDGKSGRDTEIIQNIVSRYNIEWHEIDNEPLGKYIYTNSITWGILNWGSLLGITVNMWPSPPNVWNTVIYGTTLLLVGFILLIGLLAVANHSRERAMAEAIINHSEKHDQGIIVLGEAHHLGVGKRLTDEPKLDVVNPKPKDLDWGTRVILRVFAVYERMKQ